MNNKNCIILVHIGSSNIPQYAYENLKILKQLNDNITIYFISNQFNESIFYSELSCHNIDIENIIFTKLEEIPKSLNTLKFLKNNILDTSYNDGFWLNTTYRFFVLADFITHNNISNIIHLENDYVLYCDPLLLINCCSNLKDFMVPLDANRAIPGIVWIKNSRIINLLIEFISSNNYQNDMLSLGDFVNYNEDSCSFPTLPLDYAIKHQLSVSRYSEHFHEFKALFDAAAFGQFLGGVHWHNNPHDSIFFQNESSPLLLNSKDLLWNISNQLKVPFFIHNNISHKILGLHIHSKNINAFSPFNSVSLIPHTDYWSLNNLLAKVDLIFTTDDIINTHNFADYNNFFVLKKNSKNDFIFPDKNDIDYIEKYTNFYIPAELINFFSSFIAPRLSNKFKVFTLDQKFIFNSSHLNFLNLPNLICWHVTTDQLTHEKIKILPIGLPDSINQIDIPFVLWNISKNISKNNDIYFYSTDLNVDEESIFKSLTCNPKNNSNINSDYTNHLPFLANHKFSVCISTFKNDYNLFLESQYLSTIPIILKNEWTPFYSNLPILVLDDWSDLNIIDTSEEYIKIHSKFLDLQKLKISSVL